MLFGMYLHILLDLARIVTNYPRILPSTLVLVVCALEVLEWAKA